MGFFGLFRSKEEKLTEAIAELCNDVVQATFSSSVEVERMIEEKLETTLEPSASYDLRSDIFCFYAYLVDYFSFGTLGEHRSLSVMVQFRSSGIEHFVQSSLYRRGDGIWDPHITDSLTQAKRALDAYSKAMDLVEYNAIMRDKYIESQEVFASDVAQAHQRGDVPGITDALSEEPDSMVSRLVQNVYKTLQTHIPELGPDWDILHERPDILGDDAEAIGFVELCRTIHTSVWVEIFQGINLLEKLQKMGRLIQ